MKWFRLSYIHKIAIDVSENYISEKISMKKTFKNCANKNKLVIFVFMITFSRNFDFN